MDYTSEEIQAAVDALLRGRAPAEGERDAQVEYTRLRQAALSVFVLHPRAPLYVAFLGARAALELVEAQAGRIARALEAIRATARFVTPVGDLSALENARAAAADLALASRGASAQRERGEGERDLSRAPAFRRFVQNLQSFADAYGPNLRENGALADTPEEARSLLPGLLRELRTAHEEIRARVTGLRDALDDFASLGLVESSATRVLEGARQRLDQRLLELRALNESERLAVLREVMLDVLAQKTVVPKFAAALRPSPYYPASGAVAAFSDGAHFASPARLTADVAGPYAILPGDNQIDLALNGGSPLSLALPFSFVAELVGRVAEPFVINSSNNELRLEVDGSEFVVPLGEGPRTAAEVAADVMSVLGGTSAVIERVFFPLKIDTLASTASLGGSLGRFTLLGGSLSGLGVTAGDELDVVSGENAGTTWIVTAVDPGGAFVDVVGTSPIMPAPAERLEIGPAPRALRLRDTSPVNSLALRRRIRFVPDGGPGDRAAVALGFFPGLEAQSRPTPARELASAVSASSSRLHADLAFDEVFAGEAKTDPSNPVLVVFDGDPVLGHDFGWVVEITTGPNRGHYLVTGPARAESPPGAVEVDRAVPVLRVGEGPARFSARLLRERLELASADRSVQSEVTVQGGSGAPRLFASVPRGARGATRFVQVTEVPESLEVGDRLELFESEQTLPTRAFGIIAIDRSLRVLELDQEIESTASFPLQAGASAAAFARLRAGKVAAYEAFKARLSAWLERGDNQPGFFDELGRLVNPLLANRNPRALAVSDAERALERLLARLTRAGAAAVGTLEVPPVTAEDTLELGLDSYAVDPVPGVDALIRSLRERGADRAVDVLLEGRFREFWRMSGETASYWGALSESIRELSREDLPVRKLGRGLGFEQRLIVSTAERDFEFDTSDGDTGIVGDGI
jgi:hypothetical protein